MSDFDQTIAGPDVPLPVAPQTGDTYALGRVVAQGGMGAIIEARDIRLDRLVAMKVMRWAHAGDDAARRFVDEARVTGQLEHPNIVPVHEMGSDSAGRAYYTMKMVRGVDLSSILDALARREQLDRWPLDELLTIFTKICDAVSFAHSRGVIHRDLKPANVRVGEFGEVLVMDWGLAKRIGCVEPAVHAASQASPASQSGSTVVGAVMGTPAFMPPEQADGRAASADARADVYALGAILYNILTLRAPGQGDSSEQILQKVRAGDIPDPASFTALPHCPGGQAPVGLSAVARRALQRDPGRRYQTVLELRHEVTAHQSGFATLAEGAGAWKLITLAIKRHKKEWTLGAAALLLLIAVSTAFVIGLVRKHGQAVAAKNEADVQKGVAIQNSIEAEKQKKHAQQRETEARYNSTVALMRLANQSLVAGDIDQVRRCLELTTPPPNQPDTRGFEWFYLDRQTRGHRWATPCTGPARALAISADGALVAVVDGKLIRLLDGETGREMARLADHKNEVNCVALSRDGKWLASGSGAWDKPAELLLWDVDARRVVEHLPTAPGAVMAVAFSPDARTLGVACAKLEKGYGSPQEGDRFMARVDDSAQVESLLIDLQSRAVSARLPLQKGGAISAAFSPSGDRLLLGGAAGVVSFWETSSGKMVHAVQQHRSRIWSIALHPTQELLMIAGEHATLFGDVRLVDLRMRMTLATLGDEAAGACAVAVSPDGNLIATGGWGKAIHLWHLRGEQTARVASLYGHGACIRALAFSADGSRLFSSAGVDNHPDRSDVRAWDVYAHVRTFRRGCRYPVDGQPRMLMEDLRGRAIDPISGLPIPQLVAYKQLAEDDKIGLFESKLEHSVQAPAGPLKATGKDVKPPSVEVVNVRTGQRRRYDGMKGSPRCVRLSPDGRYLAAAGFNPTTCLWDVESGKLLHQFATGTSPGCHFSPDSRFLVTAGDDREVRVWDTQTGQQKILLHGHTDVVWSAVYSHDGSRIASASWDTTVKLWDAATGEMLLTLRGHTQPIWNIQFDTNDANLFTLDDRFLVIWRGAARTPVN